MNKLQRLLGVGVIALATIGLAGCASLNEKQRNITEFIPEKSVEARVVDVDKDGRLDLIYLTQSKKGYELKVMKANNDGSFTNPELVRNYGNIDPRTLNWLTGFYSKYFPKIIDGSMK